MVEEIMAVKKEIEELKQESLAIEIIRDNKAINKRMAISFTSVIIILIILYFVTVGLFLKYINSLGYEETTTTTKTQEIEDVDSIDNSNIVNGDMYGENKTK